MNNLNTIPSKELNKIQSPQNEASLTRPQTQNQKKEATPWKGRNSKTSPVKRVFSLAQILERRRLKYKIEPEPLSRLTPIKPIIPPKSLLIILKPYDYVYNPRIIDYKHCGLLQRYIGLGGKILPRRQTRLSAKQQRYVAKTIKRARIMGLLPFVSKEKGFFIM